MSELYHHGILGQKWGVRRYQNEDGTLTEAGKKRMEKTDTKWARKNYDKIVRRTQRATSSEMKSYARSELNPKYRDQLRKGKVSLSYANEYNRKLASLMTEAASNYTAPSGRAVKFVAKRGEIGVHMVLADYSDDLSSVKNGIWSNGRIAYKQSKVNMA